MYHNELPNEGRTNVWLTPPDIIEALEPIDLDPCAADPRPFDIGVMGNYTERDDGLALPWHPEMFVFMNPPYGPHVGKWMRKLVRHRNGIALLFARTDTVAVQHALSRCDAVLFPKKRITFLTGEPPHLPGRGNAGAPSMFVAYGAEAVARLHRLDGYGLRFVLDTHEANV